MSLAGLFTFERNLRTLMDSEAFKKADESQRLEMGYRLLNSKYGGGIFGFGRVHELDRKGTKNDAS